MNYPKHSLLAACIIVASGSIGCRALADDVSPLGATASGPLLRSQTEAANYGPSPITLRLQYTGEAADNAIGGLHNGATYMNNILGQLHVNTDKAFGWTGGNFVLEGFYENASSLHNQYVGSIQDPSVIDTSGTAMFRLYQAYYKQDIGHTNLLFGIYDLETEFGATRPMDIFFNGAYAWTTTLDQSGLNGPSTYPNTSLAFRIRQQITDQWSVQAAVLDGVPDSTRYPAANAVIFNKTAGALFIAEVDYAPTRTTKVMAGYWNYTGGFTALNEFNADGSDRQVSGSRGGYIGGTTRVYSQTARRGLDAFANIGIADSRTNQTDRSLNVGFSYTGLFNDRQFDKLGFAVGIARASDAYRQMQAASGSSAKAYETNLELTYRAPINRWLTIQPDIQYWINPGLDPTLKDDLLFLVHFEVSHVFDF